MTNKRIDDRKWEAYIAYVRAYNDYKAMLRSVKLWSPEEREAWKQLMQARKEYNKARKL